MCHSLSAIKGCKVHFCVEPSSSSSELHPLSLQPAAHQHAVLHLAHHHILTFSIRCARTGLQEAQRDSVGSVAPEAAPATAPSCAGVLMVERPTTANGTPLSDPGSHRPRGMSVYPLSGAADFDAPDADTADADAALAALQTPVMVLDEIDAGLGPRLGASVGRMLHAMARGGQTLCVSHLPQVRATRTPCCCSAALQGVWVRCRIAPEGWAVLGDLHGSAKAHAARARVAVR